MMRHRIDLCAYYIGIMSHHDVTNDVTVLIGGSGAVVLPDWFVSRRIYVASSQEIIRPCYKP